MKIKKDLGVLLAVYGLLALLPIFFHNNMSLMNILIISLIWAVVAGSWDLIMGFAGIFTFGQIAFLVIGGYSSVIFCKLFGISPWFGFLIGGIVAGGAGILVGLPCLKLKGAYVALVTFAVHMILEPFLKSDIGRAIGTGGAQGILTVPPLKIGSYVYNAMEPTPWFYTLLIISFIAFFIIYKVVHSMWGYSFIALRDSELFAQSVGVNAFKYKLIVFGISAALTGMIGGVYANYVGMLSTRILGLDLFLILMVMLVLGGMGRFPGALLGAFITMFISESLRYFDTYRLIIFGLLVMVLVIKMPQGIIGLIFPLGKAGIIERTILHFREKKAKKAEMIT
ncbi:MAG: branched-chain amino acid ABC transporter permease [Desulfobacterales bacterium]|nr:branched-chain amino acid ABC transporter permease [Desulfobacterales bacterium]